MGGRPVEVTGAELLCMSFSRWRGQPAPYKG